jgi:hypothetical protein
MLALMLFLPVFVLIAASCAPAPTPEPQKAQRPVPSIKQIEARTRAASGQPADTQPSTRSSTTPDTLTTKPSSTTQPTQTAPPLLRVRREEFTGTALPEPFWTDALAAGQAPAISEQWRRNGLAVTLIDPQPLEKAAQTLPRPFSAQTQLARLPEGFDTLPGAVNITSPLQARYFRLGQTEPVTLNITPGRAQFLVRITEHDAAGATLEIVPHLFEPRQTLRVRQPQDKLLDGQVLSELILTVRLSHGQLLLLGPAPQPVPTTRPATQPATQPATSQPASDATDEPQQPSPDQPATQPAAKEPADDSPPPLLGQVLLKLSRFGRDVSAMMVIDLVPDTHGRPAAPTK